MCYINSHKLDNEVGGYYWPTLSTIFDRSVYVGKIIKVNKPTNDTAEFLDFKFKLGRKINIGKNYCKQCLGH